MKTLAFALIGTLLAAAAPAQPANLLTDGRFLVGCNYWASHAAVRMWRVAGGDVLGAPQSPPNAFSLCIDCGRPGTSAPTVETRPPLSTSTKYVLQKAGIYTDISSTQVAGQVIPGKITATIDDKLLSVNCSLKFD